VPVYDAFYNRHAQEANDGFRTALHVNPEDKQAAANLDILRGELLAL